MLYGTPSHAAHRAPSGLVIGGFAAGQHRTPPSPDQAAQLLSRTLGVLIVLGLIAMVGLSMVTGGRHGRPAPAADPDPLVSRVVDAVPLTVDEVFPDRASVRPAGAPAYRIAVTHSDADCGSATTGTLGSVLAGQGCVQVVRAGLVAPYHGYRVTAGLFNLADANGAAAVDGMLRRMIETGDGGLASLPADPDASPTAPVGWRVRGHYLLYCVITGSDGALVAGDDPDAQRITADLVDDYLGDTVLDRRAATHTSGA